MALVSLLESVAAHEIELMARVGAAEEEARRIVEQAHAEAGTFLQEEHARLDADMAARRREAADAREVERQAIEAAAEQRVREIRAARAGALEAVTRELLQWVLPAQPRGSAL
ncbi:MAG: hypothetical protein HYV26_19400 [Candidatus Hydrogenedentes bacterium]|nr:hypothetical protein [Candidatus Hydrogenedentota bacterium]MBI3119783.1 hypothetical protein [Candidatus Hydrogenedentota bacterium]